MSELSIIIPVFNEASNIEATLKTLEQNVPVPHEILIVYDDAQDNTIPVVQRLLKEFSNVTLVQNDVAPGPSGALRTGFARAQSPRVLVAMADGCDDFTQIPQLLNLVPARADIACPSRYCAGGAQFLASPRITLKALAPRSAGWLLSVLGGIPTYDPTNSFKLYSARALRTFPLSSTVSFSVTLEIVAKAHALGFRIVEIPTVWQDRRFGKTHFKLLPSLITYLPWFCVAMLRNRLFRLPSPWLRALLGVKPATHAPEGEAEVAQDGAGSS